MKIVLLLLYLITVNINSIAIASVTIDEDHDDKESQPLLGVQTNDDIVRACQNELSNRANGRPQTAQNDSVCLEHFENLINRNQTDLIFEAILKPSLPKTLRMLTLRPDLNKKMLGMYLNLFQSYLTNWLDRHKNEESPAKKRLEALLTRYAEQGHEHGLDLIQNVCLGLSGRRETTPYMSRDFCINIIHDQLHSPELAAGSKDSLQFWKNMEYWAKKLSQLGRGQFVGVPASDDYSALSNLEENPNVQAELRQAKMDKCHVNKMGRSIEDWKKVNFDEMIPLNQIKLPESANSAIGKQVRRAFMPMNKRDVISPDDPDYSEFTEFGLPYVQGKIDKEPSEISETEFNTAFHTKIQTLDTEMGPTGKQEPILLNAVWKPNGRDRSTVILFHGNGMNAETNLISKYYHALGLNVLKITMRGYQGSGGDVVRDGEMGMVLDGEAAVRFALEKLKIPRDKILLHGHSLGGYLAASAAEQFDLPAVLDRTFTTAGAVAKQFVPSPKILINLAAEHGFPPNITFALPPNHFSGKRYLATNGLNVLDRVRNTKKNCFFIYGKYDPVSPPEFNKQFLEEKYPKKPNETDSEWQARVSQYSGDNNLAGYRELDTRIFKFFERPQDYDKGRSHVMDIDQNKDTMAKLVTFLKTEKFLETKKSKRNKNKRKHSGQQDPASMLWLFRDLPQRFWNFMTSWFVGGGAQRAP